MRRAYRTYLLSLSRVVLILTTIGCLFSLLSCTGSGPVFPPNWGLTVNDISAEVVSNQDVEISWETESDLLNTFNVFYSLDGKNFDFVTETETSSFTWRVPEDVQSSKAVVKIEGYNLEYSDEPLGVSVSNQFSVLPYGETSVFQVDIPSEIKSGEETQIIFTAQDEWGNAVLSQGDIVVTMMVESMLVMIDITSSTVPIDQGQGFLSIHLVAQEPVTTTLRIAIIDGEKLYQIDVPLTIV